MMSNSRIVFIHLLIVIVAAFTVLLVVNSRTEISEIMQYTRETELPLLGMAASARFDNLAMHYKAVGESLLKDGYMRDWILDGEHDPDSLIDFMKTVRDENELFDASLVSDFTETYYGTDGRILKLSPTNYNRDGWYYHFREDADGSNIDSWYYADSGVVGVYVNIPVRDGNGHFIGVTGGGVDASVFDKTLKAFESDWDINLYLVRTDGQLVYASDKELLMDGSVYVDTLWDCKVIDQLSRWKNDNSGVIIESGKSKALVWGGYMHEWDSFFLIERSRPVRESVVAVVRRTILMDVMVTGLLILVVLMSLRFTYEKSRLSLDHGRGVIHQLQSLVYFQDVLLKKALALPGRSGNPGDKFGSESARIEKCRSSLKVLRAGVSTELSPEKHNLNDFINDFIIKSTPNAAKHGISLIGRLRSVPLFIKGDASILSFIVEDILDYAVLHSIAGSEVVFISGSSPDSVFVEISFKCLDSLEGEPGFSLLKPVLEILGATVELNTASADRMLLRLEFYHPGE